MKYMGSKARFVNEILPIILKDRKENQWFVDLFCGGCSIAQEVDGKVIANDKNKYLIAMFKGLQENRNRPYEITKQYYTSKGFNHSDFWEWCRGMTKDGHKVFISEYNAPSDFTCIWSKEITNSMNTTKTYKPTEKLFQYCL